MPKSILFILWFIFGCVGSLSLFSSRDKQGLLSGCGAWVSPYSSVSCCKAGALGGMGSCSCCKWAQHCPVLCPRAQAQVMVLSCLQPARSSCIRDQTHVSCIGRWTLHHWATREAPWEHSSRFICKRHSQMCWNKIWFVWASSLCLLSFCCVTDYLL